MEEKITGKRVLSGTNAEIFYNGLKIAGCTKISVKTTVNREEVQMGMDIDTKITGLKGEGTVSINKIYSAFESIRKEILKGKDPRGTIMTTLADPDAIGGQIERYQIGNVALSEFPLNYEMGTVVKVEFPFTFTPSDMICLDEIKE